MLKRIVPLLALALLMSCSRERPPVGADASAPARAESGSQTPEARRLTRTARLLAGIPDPDAAADDPLRTHESFAAHQAAMAELWAPHDTAVTERVRPWATASLAPLQSFETVFYPFAGADFLFPHAFFPRAHTYVLAGLERVGRLSDLATLPPPRVAGTYGRVEKAVTPLLKGTFFYTRDMETDLYQDGILTLLVTFVGGTHHRVLTAENIDLFPDGHVEAPASDRAGVTPGARVTFVDEDDPTVRTLYYFRTDISNQGLAKHGGLLAFMKTLSAPVTFTKAASYCMHGALFSTIRDYVLTQSQAVLQDDTGVPLRYFDAATWETQLFGQYRQPIPRFKNYLQPGLAAAYTEGARVRPLPFHVGYGQMMASNLLLATRRTPLAARR